MSSSDPAPWRSLFLSHISPLPIPTFTFCTLCQTPPSSANYNTDTTPFLPRARICVFRSMFGEVHSPENAPSYASELLTFTTDRRMDKVHQLFQTAKQSAEDIDIKGSGGGGPCEAVFWIEKEMTQWRIRGDAWVLSASDIDGDGAAARSVRHVLERRMRMVISASEENTNGLTEESEKEWSWSKEINAHWELLPKNVKRSFGNTQPGLLRKSEDQEKRTADGAQNFRVCVVRPSEVEQLDLRISGGGKCFRYTEMENRRALALTEWRSGCEFGLADGGVLRIYPIRRDPDLGTQKANRCSQFHLRALSEDFTFHSKHHFETGRASAHPMLKEYCKVTREAAVLRVLSIENRHYFKLIVFKLPRLCKFYHPNQHLFIVIFLEIMSFDMEKSQSEIEIITILVPHSHKKEQSVAQIQSPYLFFCSPHPSAPYSFLSQWYLSPFKAPSLTDDRTTLLFTCAEQYMMYSKAVLFHDLISARQIMAAPLPHMQRAIGRKVKGFAKETWYKYREELVFVGNWYKFTNGVEKDLGLRLLETGEKELVEASTDGRIWSIGFEEDEAVQRKGEWGLNLIGKVLTRVRRELRERRD